MNKAELVKAISEDSSLTQTDVAKFLNSFEKVTGEALAKGDNVTLVGFGSFEVVERSARTARNFKTGEPIDVPASKSVKFKSGKNLKDSLN